MKPSSIFISSNNRAKTLFIETVINFLNLGIIPVVYGDMVYDEIKGGTVLSTDRMFYELAKSFEKKSIGVDRVVFCGVTDGVIDKKGMTIKVINRIIFPKIEDVFFCQSIC